MLISMTTTLPYRCGLLGVGLLLAVSGLGCGLDFLLSKEADKPVEVKKVAAGKNITVEIEGERRRVLIDAQVCLRDGQLEQLLTRKSKKEHEAILAADIDARDLMKALILAGAKQGSPVRYDPKYEPARGTTIKITLQYEEKGKLVSVPAQQWIRSARTKKDLQHEWVFGGSRLVQDPFDKNKPPYFLANNGDVICVANMEGALLDLPIQSSSEDADLVFEANPDRIPKLETKVTVILEPVLDKKK